MPDGCIKARVDDGKIGLQGRRTQQLCTFILESCVCMHNSILCRLTNASRRLAPCFVFPALPLFLVCEGILADWKCHRSVQICGPPLLWPLYLRSRHFIMGPGARHFGHAVRINLGPSSKPRGMLILSGPGAAVPGCALVAMPDWTVCNGSLTD